MRVGVSVRVRVRAHLPVADISPLYLPYISLYLPYISPMRAHLPVAVRARVRVTVRVRVRLGLGVG